MEFQHAHISIQNIIISQCCDNLVQLRENELKSFKMLIGILCKST